MINHIDMARRVHAASATSVRNVNKPSSTLLILSITVAAVSEEDVRIVLQSHALMY